MKIIIDDYESKDITADEAGPQLGLDADKFANKWKRFKAAERDRKRKTMTAMEQQVDWEEEKLENDEEMGEYEMMRLRNLKEKLMIFQQLQIQSTKAKVAAVTPVKKNWTKTLPPPRREPSARIQELKLRFNYKLHITHTFFLTHLWEPKNYIPSGHDHYRIRRGVNLC